MSRDYHAKRLAESEGISLRPAESFTDDDLAAASRAVADWCRAHPFDFEPVFSALGFEQTSRPSITVSYESFDGSAPN